jgi:hypothetical protein
MRKLLGVFFLLIIYWFKVERGTEMNGHFFTKTFRRLS